MYNQSYHMNKFEVAEAGPHRREGAATVVKFGDPCSYKQCCKKCESEE